jgi:hypothetical protein
MEVLFTETGAGDPNFNLRTEQAVILRVKDATDHTFTTMLEPHGEYNGSREFTTASATSVAGLERFTSGDAEVIRVSSKSGSAAVLGLSWDTDNSKTHSVKTADSNLDWEGFYRLFED